MISPIKNIAEEREEKKIEVEETIKNEINS
jgi:hypothetical protein